MAVVTVTSTASGPGAGGMATVTDVAESDRIGALSVGPKCTAVAPCSEDPKMVSVPPPPTGPLPLLRAMTAGQPPGGWRSPDSTTPSGEPHPVAMS